MPRRSPWHPSSCSSPSSTRPTGRCSGALGPPRRPSSSCTSRTPDGTSRRESMGHHLAISIAFAVLLAVGTSFEPAFAIMQAFLYPFVWFDGAGPAQRDRRERAHRGRDRRGLRRAVRSGRPPTRHRRRGALVRLQHGARALDHAASPSTAMNARGCSRSCGRRRASWPRCTAMPASPTSVRGSPARSTTRSRRASRDS